LADGDRHGIGRTYFGPSPDGGPLTSQIAHGERSSLGKRTSMELLLAGVSDDNRERVKRLNVFACR